MMPPPHVPVNAPTELELSSNHISAHFTAETSGGSGSVQVSGDVRAPSGIARPEPCHVVEKLSALSGSKLSRLPAGRDQGGDALFDSSPSSP
ncbi:uncharacterized protein PAN0_005d2503 [Moesziomyces antarcticus]|uniref:Uncharacterized protein n=1 Tax=Pseudozyma antarctica TaxID=84753 RepID=A0A081CC95_PSEA2|nr:uncharacterized protein PAN0_005d2503 [Moesziomyces antarcticus]GAK64291.1 hypothetical protein PAN0_005d2503 [Moesziomyces antarcticus]